MACRCSGRLYTFNMEDRKGEQVQLNLYHVVSGDRVVGLLSGVRPLYFSPVEHSRGRNSKQVTSVLRNTESSLRALVVMCFYLRLPNETLVKLLLFCTVNER
jgi:hypothetical protein